MCYLLTIVWDIKNSSFDETPFLTFFAICGKIEEIIIRNIYFTYIAYF